MWVLAGDDTSSSSGLNTSPDSHPCSWGSVEMDAGAGSFGEMLPQFVAQSLVRSTSFLTMGLKGAAVKERFIKLCMGRCLAKAGKLS